MEEAAKTEAEVEAEEAEEAGGWTGRRGLRSTMS